MKIQLIAAGALCAIAAMPSFATDLCKGDGKEAAVTTASKFIATSFTQKCSNNVISKYDEDNLAAWVSSASKKGKSYFIGNTNGGAAIPMAGAEVKAGTDPDPSTYLTDAKKLGGGS